MKKLFLLIGLSVMTSLFGLTEAEVAIFQKSANQGNLEAKKELETLGVQQELD